MYRLFLMLLFLNSCIHENDTNEKLLFSIEESCRESINRMTLSSNRFSRRIEYHVSDEGKIKYQGIRIASNNVIQGFSRMYEILSLKEGIPFTEIRDTLKLLKKLQQKEYIEHLENEGKLYGLRDSNILHLVNEVKGEFGLVDSNMLLLSSTNYSSISRRLLHGKIILDLKILENKLLDRLLMLIGGRRIRCYFNILPNIIPSQNILKRGDRFEAMIGIIPDDHEFLPSNMQMKIDNKIIPFDNGRYATYISEPINEEERKINIECKIKDEVTGEFVLLWDNYEYIIRTLK